MTIQELHQKDVIRRQTGENMGRIDDVMFSQESAVISAVVLHGRSRFFGLFGREDDLLIPWESIKSIGADVLMVECEQPTHAPARPRHWF